MPPPNQLEVVMFWTGREEAPMYFGPDDFKLIRAAFDDACAQLGQAMRMCLDRFWLIAS